VLRSAAVQAHDNLLNVGSTEKWNLQAKCCIQLLNAAQLWLTWPMQMKPAVTNSFMLLNTQVLKKTSAISLISVNYHQKPKLFFKTGAFA
jgi:hypothetical protein